MHIGQTESSGWPAAGWRPPQAVGWRGYVFQSRGRACPTLLGSAATCTEGAASHRRKTKQFPVWPRRGQPWVAAGFNLRLAEPHGPFNPDGVHRGKGRPLQGRIPFSPSVSVGFTYGYSRCPASREGRRRIMGWLILAPMGQQAIPRCDQSAFGEFSRPPMIRKSRPRFRCGGSN
jgi:hypothetical protein